MKNTLSDSDVANHDEDVDLQNSWHKWWLQLPSFAVSMMLHIAVVLILALFTMAVKKEKLVTLSASVEEELAFEQMEFDLDFDLPVDPELSEEDVQFEPELTEIGPEFPVDEPIVEEAAPLALLDPTLLETLITDDLAADVSGNGLLGTNVGAMLRGRNPDSRLQRALARGGSRQSEAAVDSALKWFARHQFPDGSWNFNHATCPECQGRCSGPGGNTSTTGATGMVLLCYLGAGQTHKAGQYKKVVLAGLKHLLDKQMPNGSLAGGPLPSGSDILKLQGNSGYTHGFAALALCEAYSMTRDPRLEKATQAAVQYTINFQDPSGGGFKYEPRIAGDISASIAQIMTLKSAKQIKLDVPAKSIAGIVNFVDSCRIDQYGANYGYDATATTGTSIQPIRDGSFYKGAIGPPSQTSCGLLARMYLGWPRNQPGLQQGVTYLSGVGPCATDMYYNYYATLVMHHYGGREWKSWNAKMRDFLVSRQSKTGHESGSWDPFGGWSDFGGRTMDTAFACMTLEVYYRYMPIYDSHVPD